jgi:hypothetical protein
MKQVTLQFPSILELIDFSLFIDGTMFEADRRKNTLTCELSAEEIKLARENYQAIVVVEQSYN